MTYSEVEVRRWTNELSCTFGCTAALQRLLLTAMLASWAALGQKVNAQIKLLGEYFGDMALHLLVDRLPSSSAHLVHPFCSASDGVGSRISSLRFLERRSDFRDSLVRIAITPVRSRRCSCKSAWIQKTQYFFQCEPQWVSHKAWPTNVLIRL